MAGITPPELDHPGFVAAFTLAMLATFCLSLASGLRQPKRLADRSIEGLNAAYANTGFMGFPLCLAALGQASLIPAIIATILTACVLFAGVIILIEKDLRAGQSFGATLATVVRALARNPLIAAPALGLLAALAHAAVGFVVPAPVARFTGLLGAAASPCALVTIGLFLAQSAGGAAPALIARLVALKLLIQPGLTWLLAFHVFAMPRLWAETAVLISALPTGTGPFMLAKLYDREPALTSRAILVSTLLSTITVSALVSWLGAS
jgi:predicted permease